MFKFYIYPMVLLAVLGLSACGGGGSGSGGQGVTPQPSTAPTETAQPVASPSPSPSASPEASPSPTANPEVLSREKAVEEMGVGINLGNTFDAPEEGAWAPAAEQFYFTAFKDAGFNNVRIPVTWDTHVASTFPYQVDPAYMDRIEQVVDWALAEGLYVILNAHHEVWIQENYSQANQDRFDAIWRQIAERFQGKSPRLLWEILNEPVGMTAEEVDDLNARILGIMREESPTRLVIFSGNGFTPLDALVAAKVPDVNDDYLIGNFHSYDPWPFAGQCTRRWGSEQDMADLEGIYDRAKAWSDTNGIPVTINEFGVAHNDFLNPENVCNEEDRLNYLRAHVRLGIERGLGMTFWDDAGSFGSYNRLDNTWGPEKDILVAPNFLP